jgi:transcriptional regulator of acetoin/glycerol metabolism
VWALEQTNGHHDKAARLLGISRAQLFRLKKKFDIRSDPRE